MKYSGLVIAFFAACLFVLPSLTAQEKKGDDAKADKKDIDAKDPEKKDTPKEPKEKKEKKPVEEKPEHGAVIKTKIVSMKADSARDFTIEMAMPDPQKIASLQMWSFQQMQSLMGGDPRTRGQRMYQYQMQLAIKQANETTTMKPFEVRAAEKCKVRTMFLPLEYDDTGKIKKRTRQELAELKGKSKLPGYPADFDLLKIGQYVELYLAKPAAAPKGSAPAAKNKNKKKKDEDDPDVPIAVPEVVMIVIWAEPMGR
jgi:hypothetical protein